MFSASLYFKENDKLQTPEQYAKNELCKDAIVIPSIGSTKEYCLNLVNENIKNYENNNVKGIKTLYNLYENPTYTIIFTHENLIFIFVSSGETGSLPTELGIKTIDQILSTFKFLGPVQSKVSVQIAEQSCRANQDCTKVNTECSCGCGSSVNKTYENKYKQLYESTCANYKGPICDIYCDNLVSKCINGKCTLSKQ